MYRESHTGVGGNVKTRAADRKAGNRSRDLRSTVRERACSRVGQPELKVQRGIDVVNPNCKAWTYVTSESACWLKGKVSQHSMNAMTISGALSSLHVVGLEEAKKFEMLLSEVKENLVGINTPGRLS